MSSLDKMHILLVHPPVARPSLPPWMLAQALSYLDDPSLSPEPYDANLDFFLNHLLTSKQANRFIDLDLYTYYFVDQDGLRLERLDTN